MATLQIMMSKGVTGCYVNEWGLLLGRRGSVCHCVRYALCVVIARIILGMGVATKVWVQ